MNLKLLTHRGTAYFQAFLSIAFVFAYFTVLMCFLTGNVRVPGEFHDMCQTLVGFLTAGLGVILQFWFSRQRASEPAHDAA